MFLIKKPHADAHGGVKTKQFYTSKILTIMDG